MYIKKLNLNSTVAATSTGMGRKRKSKTQIEANAKKEKGMMQIKSIHCRHIHVRTLLTQTWQLEAS